MWNRALPVVATVIMLAVVATGQTTPGAKPTTAQFMPTDLSWRIRTSDEAYLVLLDPGSITHYPDWRDRFSGQVLGYGIRTPRQALSNADIATAKTLLLDPASWGTEEKFRCGYSGEAALLMRGPFGEVTIMFELECARAHVRDDTSLCLTAYGQIDAVLSKFMALVNKYFPDDEYIQERYR